MVWPVEVPNLPDGGEPVAALQTTWVEPAYLETDTSWCTVDENGHVSSPVSATTNGGAYGAKQDGDGARPEVEVAAQQLAQQYGTAVRVKWFREDVVRRGPKRPPVGGVVDAAGHVLLRVVRNASPTHMATEDPAAQADDELWDGLVARVNHILVASSGPSPSGRPWVAVEWVHVPGPPTSPLLRGALLTEAWMLHHAARTIADPNWEGALVSPEGAAVTVRYPDGPDGVKMSVHVDAGAPLDEVVLRSYCLGAVHQGLGLVRTEAIRVDDDGEVQDLTIRSFGVLKASEMPEVTVEVAPTTGEPVPVSELVFAAVAATDWYRKEIPVRVPMKHGGMG